MLRIVVGVVDFVVFLDNFLKGLLLGLVQFDLLSIVEKEGQESIFFDNLFIELYLVSNYYIRDYMVFDIFDNVFI